MIHLTHQHYRDSFNHQQMFLPYWQHAHQISSDNEEKGFRKDYYGRIIQKNAFWGDKQHQYGWTLAQLTPANKNNQIVIPINIVPIHINTSKRTYNEKELIVQGSQEAKIKRRRKNFVYEIIDFIVSLPGIIFLHLNSDKQVKLKPTIT